MAIVKMKKLRVVAMADRKEELLRGLLHLGCVEVGELTDPAWAGLMQRETSRLTETRSQITDVNTALAAVKRYGKLKDGLFIQRHPISEKDFLDDTAAEKARDVCGKINDALREIARLQGEEGRLLSRQASLRPWATLDMPLEMEGTEHTRIRLGVCPGGTDVGAIRTQLAGEDAAAEIYEISADKQQVYCLLICHLADEERVQELLRPFSFSVTGSQGVTGTASEALAGIDARLAQIRRDQEAAATAIAESGASRDALRVYADRLAAEAAKESSAERLLTDGTIVFFEGWAPAENMKEVQALLEKTGCAWEAVDPAEEEYPEVPIKLKNNWLTRPLNMVTEMYSLPAYGNVDPNPLMAPFFILFYGIMMADMGYGLLMMAASLVISRKYRPKGTTGHLFSLLGLCGVSTFIMGALTGGFFGDFLTQVVEAHHRRGLCPAGIVHTAERHPDDLGGIDVSGPCPDRHWHGHQLHSKAEAGRCAGCGVRGADVVAGVPGRRPDGAGRHAHRAVSEHRPGAAGAHRHREGLRQDHRHLRLSL